MVDPTKEDQGRERNDTDAAYIGRNFLLMSAQDVVEWCRHRKSALGWTNAQIAERAHMAKGTVDGVLAGRQMNFRYDSIRDIVLVLAGNAAALQAGAEDEVRQLTMQVHRLQKENTRLRCESNAEGEKCEDCEGSAPVLIQHRKRRAHGLQRRCKRLFRRHRVTTIVIVIS